MVLILKVLSSEWLASVYFHAQKWVVLCKFDYKEGKRESENKVKRKRNIEILCLWAKNFPICLTLNHHNFKDINSNKGYEKK